MSKLSAVVAVTLMGLSLAACKPKPKDAAVSAAPAPAPAASAPAPETPAAPAQPTSAASYISQEGFDAGKIPVSNATSAAFPYLAYPETVPEAFQDTEKADFDEAYFIVGKKLRKVEGRVESHQFSLSNAKLSEVAARRNYENLIKAMGGVKVSDGGLTDVVSMDNEAYVDLHHKLRMYQLDTKYDTWVVRRPDQLIWIALMTTDSEVKTLVVAEEPFKQTIGFVTADAMQAALSANGHVALYINFDTDKASIRPDGRPAVDEIAKLMDKDPSLKLTIEGHTDNSGDAQHNKTLSQQRADAVMGSLMGAGIAKERLTAVGLGDTKPVADNKDEAGRAKNRRVELVKQA